MAVPIKSSTPSAERDLWRTPPELFRMADSLYGPFTLDAAADASNHLCDLWLGPGSPLGNEDALGCDWGAMFDYRRVWCNPPYSNGMDDVFTYYAWDQVKQYRILSATLLIKANTGKKVFHKLIWDRAHNRPRPGVTLDFLPGRVAFIRPDGTVAKANTFESMLVTFGQGVK